MDVIPRGLKRVSQTGAASLTRSGTTGLLRRDPAADRNEAPPRPIDGHYVCPGSAHAEIRTESHRRQQAGVELVQPFQLREQLLSAHVAARAPQRLHEDPRGAVGGDLQRQMTEREPFLPAPP